MKIEPLSKTYGGVTVLRFSGAELTPGRITAVIGANGCGKSTLAKLLAGVEKPDRGRIAGLGSVGYLPQKSYAFHFSTRSNLLLNGRDRAKADALMRALGIEALSHKRAYRMSGGETARMALARLLMRRYDLVILDEPTAAMDMESAAAAEELVAAYVRETNCALLLITHSLQQARRLADDAIYLDHGSVIEAGPAAELLYRPARPETRRFLAFYGFGEAE